MTYPSAESHKEFISILGLKLNLVGVPEVHAYIQKVIQAGEQALVLNSNIHCTCIAQTTPWFRAFLNQAQMVFCDGDGVRWGARLLGYKPPPKIGVTRWLWDLARLSEEKGYSLFLLGAKPGVAEDAGKRLKEKYPRLKIAGVHHGYFQREGAENDAVIEAINRVKPDILVAAFGMPIQEQWFRDYGRKTDVHIFIAGGAVLDYAAGRLGQVPEWMLNLGLEWLFRVLEEPRRLFWRYATEIPFFFSKIFAAMFRKWLFGADCKKDDGKSF